MIPIPDKPFWKGPCVDGITQSLINNYLQCPFRFYIKAILGLEEDLPPHPNLVWGDCYHYGLEALINSYGSNASNKDSIKAAQAAAYNRLKNHWGQSSLDPSDDSYYSYDSYKATIHEMLRLYDTSILPEGPWKAEQEFNQLIAPPGSTTQYRFKGKRDGLLAPSGALLEHKAKSYYAIDPAHLRDEIEEDLQCNIYMTVSEVETVYYDLIGIPETVRGMKNPYRPVSMTDFEYAQSLVLGGTYKDNGIFPIIDNTHAWISQAPYTITHSSQKRYWDRTIWPIVRRIHEWYDYVTDSSFDPNNPSCYNSIFYRQPVRTFVASNTEKFKCEYHGYLTGNEDLCNLKPINSLYNELDQKEV